MGRGREGRGRYQGNSHAVSNTNAYDWAFLSGRVAAMESRLIRNDAMQRMAAFDDLNDVFLSISDTAYKDSFPIIEKLYEADQVLGGILAERLAEVARYSPIPDVVGMFRIGDDFRDFKSYLKRKLAGLDIPRGNGGAIGDVTWERVLGGLKTDLPGFWYDAAATVRAEAEASPPELVPQAIDLVLDSEQLSQQVRTARAIGYPIIASWAEALAVARSVEIIWRAKNSSYDMARLRRLFLRGELDRPLLQELADLPLEAWPDRLRSTALGPLVDDVFSRPEGERVAWFAKRAADLLLARVRPAMSATFGPDRVFGYLCGLSTEIFNLRLVLSGRVNKISKHLLQARLREQYV